MYNRYIRDDKGVYTRVPQDEEPKESVPPRREEPRSNASTHKEAQTRPQADPGRTDARANHAAEPGRRPPSQAVSDGLTGLLRHFLDRFHMDRVDTGDLLLLGLLFFLFREDTDEELLTALGLLLIL